MSTYHFEGWKNILVLIYYGLIFTEFYAVNVFVLGLHQRHCYFLNGKKNEKNYSFLIVGEN